MLQLNKKTIPVFAVVLLLHHFCLRAQPAQFPCLCNLASCPGTIHNIDYSNAAIWTPVDLSNGSMTVSGGVMNYNLPAGGNYNRTHTTLNGLAGISNNFVAECRVTVTGGNAPAHYVMAFSASNIDPLSTNGTGYPLTNNDALAVILGDFGTAPASGSCCTNPLSTTRPWGFKIMAKDNASAPVFSDSIPLNNSLPATYYIRLIRANNWTHLAVFSDAGFTTNIPGSPVCFFIPPNISFLRRLQHGVITWGSPYRTLAMTLDDTRICTYTNGCTPAESKTAGGPAEQKGIQYASAENDAQLQVLPNPSRGIFRVVLHAADDEIKSIVLYDAAGRHCRATVHLQQLREATVNTVGLVKGIYMVEITSRKKSWRQRHIIE